MSAPTVGTTAAELVAAVARRLAQAGVATPHADARWLTLHALDWSAADLALHGTRPLTPAQVDAVERLADRRAAREPLQLVVGGAQFRGHALEVRAGVFIPRPETESLVDHALAHLPDGGTVVEPCTGSGAVACAIAVERPTATVVATDRDAGAVRLAARNAARLGATVDLYHGSLLDPIPAGLRGRIDVLVANPPYLATAELSELPDEVAGWDPVAALEAGPSGHEVSDQLISAARDWLAPGGWLVLELDERRVAAAARRAAGAGLVAVGTRRDLTGRPRFVLARRAASTQVTRRPAP